LRANAASIQIFCIRGDAIRGSKMVIFQKQTFIRVALSYFPSCGSMEIAATSNDKGHKTAPGAVNWNSPPKREIVERAMSDGITDPARIVSWAKNYKVDLTIEEVRHLQKELKK
jgi:hypothetical protein